MNGLVVFLTAILELCLLPFAVAQRMRARAIAAKHNRYTGQRNRWGSNPQ